MTQVRKVNTEALDAIADIFQRTGDQEDANLVRAYKDATSKGLAVIDIADELSGKPITTDEALRRFAFAYEDFAGRRNNPKLWIIEFL